MSNSSRNNASGNRAGCATLFSIFGITFAVIFLLGLACILGTGTNQAVTSLEIQSQAYVGMSLDDFCREVGIPKPNNFSGGRFVVSRKGWLSLWVPQHEIFADFDKNNQLVQAYEVNYCGADENGRQLPLYDPDTGWPSPIEE
jgi:hypothetical protein